MEFLNAYTNRSFEAEGKSGNRMAEIKYVLDLVKMAEGWQSFHQIQKKPISQLMADKIALNRSNNPNKTKPVSSTQASLQASRDPHP